MTHIQIAPDVEFKMDINIPEITDDARDYDLQQHKAEVYAEFEKRLKKAFPEGFKINAFEFGQDNSLQIFRRQAVDINLVDITVHIDENLSP